MLPISLTMEEIFILTWSGIILGTTVVTLLGCWVYEKLHKRKIR